MEKRKNCSVVAKLPPPVRPSISPTTILTHPNPCLPHTEQPPFFTAQQGFYLNTSSLTVDGGSATNLSDYDRRLSEFNHKRPRAKPTYQSRVTSWSDPLSARRGITQDDGTGAGMGTRRTSIEERESLRVVGSVEEGYSRDDMSVLSFKPYEGQVLTRYVCVVFFFCWGIDGAVLRHVSFFVDGEVLTTPRG